MSASNTLAAAIAKLDSPGVAVALHTADPGDLGNMATNEVSYAGYERVNVAPAWPVVCIHFPPGTGGGGKATHYSVGAVGGTDFFFAGPLLVPIPVGDGLTPHIWTER